MSTSRLAFLVSLGALALPAAAHAATVEFVGTGADRVLTVTGGNGRDRGIEVELKTVPASVEFDEQITVTGGFETPLTAGAGCTVLQTEKQGVVTRTAICKVVRGVPVEIDLRGGNDDLRLTGDLGGVELPDPRRPAVQADGGDGDDRLFLALANGGRVPNGPVRAILRGGAGRDTMGISSRGGGRLEGGADNDELFGDDGPDELIGGSGADKLKAGGGDDLVDGGTNGDVIDGDLGFDTVAYDDGTRAAGVEVTLDGRCNDGGTEDTRPAIAVNVAPVDGCSPNGTDRDQVRGVETIVGTRFADTLIGGTGATQIFGQAGDDTLEGGPLADVLHGGIGADTILARDENPDQQIVCEGLGGVTGFQPNPNDRAILDQFDPANPDCAIIERGGQDVQGPADTGTPPPTPPAPGQPASPPPPAAPPSGLLNGGGELGSLPGGARQGKPPRARLVTRRATPDAKGRLALRVVCEYEAKACASTLTLTTARTLAAGKGRKRVRIAKGARVGRASRTIPWGGSATVSVTLNAKTRRLLSRSRKPIPLRLTAVARDSGQGSSATPVTLRAQLLVGRRSSR